ncbi:hypothetical protein Glove_4g22 [Diversispora epigaea]|uniref:Homeobox domain-containing protein n=1 Tax=Diversispora epigaea TaxID=1348612 RepID=A0A397JR97_9GLOM|nr:hypothetical protein Glove_4g22 [Diversispora epigaea]
MIKRQQKNNKTNNNQLKEILLQEEPILEKLLIYKEKIPDHIYDETLQLLGTEWDKKRLYNWWNYRIKQNN